MMTTIANAHSVHLTLMVRSPLGDCSSTKMLTAQARLVKSQNKCRQAILQPVMAIEWPTFPITTHSCILENYIDTHIAYIEITSNLAHSHPDQLSIVAAFACVQHDNMSNRF
jgi:hypothetical protein